MEFEHTAGQVLWKDGAELWATFDLKGMAKGAYDVKIEDGAHTAVLDDVFTVNDGKAGAAQHQLSAITYPDGTVEHFAYDVQGRLLQDSLNNGAEALTYAFIFAGSRPSEMASYRRNTALERKKALRWL